MEIKTMHNRILEELEAEIRIFMRENKGWDIVNFCTNVVDGIEKFFVMLKKC